MERKSEEAKRSSLAADLETKNAILRETISRSIAWKKNCDESFKILIL
jgi:hypothetical protein